MVELEKTGRPCFSKGKVFSMGLWSFRKVRTPALTESFASWLCEYNKTLVSQFISPPRHVFDIKGYQREERMDNLT